MPFLKSLSSWFPHLFICTLAIYFTIPLIKFPNFAPFRSHFLTSRSTSNMTALPKTQAEWRQALDALPSTPDKIPSFFFAHGSPMLASRDGMMPKEIMDSMGPRGSLAKFLGDFGPHLIKKYNPKGIVVFSAHWETSGERLGLCHLIRPSGQRLMMYSDRLRR